MNEKIAWASHQSGDNMKPIKIHRPKKNCNYGYNSEVNRFIIFKSIDY